MSIDNVRAEQTKSTKTKTYRHGSEGCAIEDEKV